MNEQRIKQILGMATDEINKAAGDDFGQDRDYHTRRAVGFMLHAVEGIAEALTQNEQPQPEAPRIGGSCPECGNPLEYDNDGWIICTTDGCVFQHVSIDHRLPAAAAFALIEKWFGRAAQPAPDKKLRPLDCPFCESETVYNPDRDCVACTNPLCSAEGPSSPGLSKSRAGAVRLWNDVVSRVSA